MTYMPSMRAKPDEPRCDAVYDGADGPRQCEYRVHKGRVHAALTGAVQWLADPLRDDDDVDR